MAVFSPCTYLYALSHTSTTSMSLLKYEIVKSCSENCEFFRLSCCCVALQIQSDNSIYYFYITSAFHQMLLSLNRMLLWMEELPSVLSHMVLLNSHLGTTFGLRPVLVMPLCGDVREMHLTYLTSHQ